MQGIPQVISQSNESENDGNWWKLGGLAVLGIISAAAAGYSLSIFLAGADFAYFLSSLVFLAIFGVVLILQAVFTIGSGRLRLLSGLEALAVLPFFASYYQDFSVTALAGSVLWLWFVVRGISVANNLARGGMRPEFGEPAKRMAAAAVTGWLLLSVSLGYVRFVEQNGLSEGLGKRLTREALISLEPAFQIQFPKVSFRGTTAEFLAAVGEEMANRSGVLTDLGPAEYVPPQAKNQIIAEAAKKVREDLEKSLNLKLSPNEPVSEAVYRVVKSFWSGFAPAFREALAAAVAVLVFFSLRGLAFVAVWLMRGLAWVVYRLLIAFGFARVASEMRAREFLILN